MRRSTKELCILAAVLVLCAAAYLGARAWNVGRAETDDAVYAARWTDLSVLTIERGETALSFERGEDGVWYSLDEPDFPLEQSRLTQLEETLGALEASKVIPDPEEDASYGLDTPVRRIIVQCAGGASGVLLVGDAVNGSYYARLEGETTVYTISSALVSQTDQDLLEMISLDTLPTVTEANAQSVSLTLNAAQYAFTKETVSGTEGEGDADTWSLNGAALSEEDEALAGGLDALAGLSFRSCYAWRPDGETLSTCGMDAPARLTVTWQSEELERYTLLLGGTDENGNRYAMLEGSEQLNLLSASASQALLGLADAGT